MRAKRQIMSLLLVLLLVWQGFSFANAETGSTQGTSIVGSGTGTEASAASNSAISGTGTASSSTISGTGTASKQGKAIANALSDVKLVVDGNALKEGSSFANYQSMQFKATIKVQGLNIEEGDYISIQLPKELKSSDLSFNISGDHGKILAKGEYTQATKEMRIVFTKDAEHYSGTDGSVLFNTEIDKEVVKAATKTPLELKVNGKTVINYNVDYKIIDKENPVSFWKSRDRKLVELVDQDGNTHYLIHYTVSLDARHIEKVPGATDYENVVFTDTLQSDALSYFDVKHHFTDANLKQSDIDTYAPILRTGIWRSGQWQNGVWVSAPDDTDANRGPFWSLRDKQNNTAESSKDFFTPNYSADGRSFTYTIGKLNPDDGFFFSYYVEINEAFKNGTIYKNQAKLTGDGIISREQIRDFEVSEAGGFLNGKTFNLQVKKVGDDGEALQGAKFTLVNPKTNYTKTIVTDEDGIAKLENVFKADYVLTEVEAPEGYELDSTPRTISKTDFENSIANGATVEVEMLNKKKEVVAKETNLSVKKEWVLDPALATNKPEKVVVSVLKNGVKDENLTVELSAANGWKASFSNLPKQDANGKEIVYTVSEEELAGFKAAISGSEKTGFTISNYNGSRVVIPVTKIWQGKGPHPDHLNVQLFANGEKVATYTLNKANGWQHSFDMPKLDANGKEIRYTVTEDSVAGYTASTENNSSTGYVNVFVNKKNDVPPVKPGNGGGNGGGNPPKPSPNPSTPSEPGDPSGNGERPGEVLNANRPSISSPESNPEGSVLGAGRNNAPEAKGTVLGSGRGQTKTGDSANMPVYFALFALTGLGFCIVVLNNYRKEKKN
ncbi:Cna B-type domain-containing protein [Oribacterium asaccharolyticum]|uniref:Cna B-type domain-containing protein n=1 Tax=Oribacterium asaccharolyticum TaxID=1501332 RepID=UPI0028E750BB|nr:Cna B-type domain-containing protein [Oribacterium asaccharolyticum]